MEVKSVTTLKWGYHTKKSIIFIRVNIFQVSCIQHEHSILTSEHKVNLNCANLNSRYKFYIFVTKCTKWGCGPENPCNCFEQTPTNTITWELNLHGVMRIYTAVTLESTPSGSDRRPPHVRPPLATPRDALTNYRGSGAIIVVFLSLWTTECRSKSQCVVGTPHAVIFKSA